MQASYRKFFHTKLVNLSHLFGPGIVHWGYRHVETGIVLPQTVISVSQRTQNTVSCSLFKISSVEHQRKYDVTGPKWLFVRKSTLSTMKTMASRVLWVIQLQFFGVSSWTLSLYPHTFGYVVY